MTLQLLLHLRQGPRRADDRVARSASITALPTATSSSSISGRSANANEDYFDGEIAFWNELAAHPNYDEFWQARNILPHLTERHVRR